MIKKLWALITAIPKAAGAFVSWLWGNLSDLFSAFHSVFRLERLFWSVLYGVIGVGGYTAYAWLSVTLKGLEWSLQLIDKN